MQTLSESEALAAISELALTSGLEVVNADVERSELMETMPILNVYVSMVSPQRVHSDMKALEKNINAKWGGSCRTGLYYAEIGYDEVPEGQAQIQIDGLNFDLDSICTPTPTSLFNF
jgi:hypothetical protein